MEPSSCLDEIIHGENNLNHLWCPLLREASIAKRRFRDPSVEKANSWQIFRAQVWSFSVFFSWSAGASGDSYTAQETNIAPWKRITGDILISC